MRNLLMSLLAVAVLASGALAQGINSILPASGSVGTVITITGSGAGSKKPSVFLTSPETGKKKYALKVISHSDTMIVATITKGVVGSFDVNVKVNKTTVTVADAFSLLPPTITTGQTATADIGTSLTLNGTHFGTKKGKVVVGAKKATVTAWTDTAITYNVPTTIPNGAVVVDISNTLGGDSISAYLTITGSSVKLGSNKVTGKIGGKTFKPHLHFLHVIGDIWTVSMQELGKHARFLKIDNITVATIPGVFHGTEIPPATLELDIAAGGGTSTTFTGTPGDFTITITHFEQSKIAGVISGNVVGLTKTIPIQSVQFIYDTGF